VNIGSSIVIIIIIIIIIISLFILIKNPSAEHRGTAGTKPVISNITDQNTCISVKTTKV